MTPWTKRLSIFLTISVALNLLLAGFLLGRGLHRGGERMPQGVAPGAALWGRGHGPGRGAFERHRAELHGEQVALRAARRSALEVLRKEPFDAKSLEQALAGLRGETVKSQEALHRALLDAANAATPEERKRFAHAFESRGHE